MNIQISLKKSNNRNSSRFLTTGECQELAGRVADMAVGGGDTAFMMESSWYGNLRYARNEISTTGDIRENDLILLRDIKGAAGTSHSTRIDENGLESAIRRCERLLRLRRETGGDRRFRETFLSDMSGTQVQDVPSSNLDRDHQGKASSRENTPGGVRTAEEILGILVQSVEAHAEPKIFFDSTYDLGATERVEEIQGLIESAIKADLRAAGYIEVSAHGRAVMDTWGRSMYYPFTRAQFSVTIRDPKGTGSGWAGVDFSDWNLIDPGKLSEIAMDKCLRSRNPVAVEPGRYVAILEPQAVCDIFSSVVGSLRRTNAEQGYGPWALEDSDSSKIGLKVLDERITVTSDPMDPGIGFPPFDRYGNVYHPVKWIENGVLKELFYERSYGIKMLGKNSGLPNSNSFRLHGGEHSIDEMIATTRRGLIVTRFHGIGVDPTTLMSTGYTRDGVWLVENGKISKAVKNFRIAESPLFIFNNLEMLGEPVRVFRPGFPTVVPPAKVRDFNFVALSEAI